MCNCASSIRTRLADCTVLLESRHVLCILIVKRENACWQANPKLALAVKIGIGNILSRANATFKSGDATLPVHVGFLRDIQRAADVLASRLEEDGDNQLSSSGNVAEETDQSSSSTRWWRDVEHRADRLRANFDERHGAQRKITSSSIVFRPWNWRSTDQSKSKQVTKAKSLLFQLATSTLCTTKSRSVPAVPSAGSFEQVPNLCRSAPWCSLIVLCRMLPSLLLHIAVFDYRVSANGGILLELVTLANSITQSLSFLPVISL